MAVAYLTSAKAAIGYSITSAESDSFTVSGSNTVAVVAIATTEAVTISSVSAGGQSCSLISTIYGGDGGVGKIYLYGCANPASGTASASWTPAASAAMLVVTVFTGAAQTSTFENVDTEASTWAQSVNVALTSTSGDMTTSAHICSDRTGRATDQTLAAACALSDYLACDYGPGTGTATHTWSWTNNTSAAVIGCNVKAAASGAAPPASGMNRGTSLGLNRRVARSN